MSSNPPAPDAGTQHPHPVPDGVQLRDGQAADAADIVRLVNDNLEAGHLLPRTLDDVSLHAERFIVLEAQGHVVGCCELAPLSRAVAEVRSLVIDARWRRQGLGTRLLEELRERALRKRFSVLCAFTHEPHNFIRLGFSITPHVWFPEKVALDCVGCARFRTCGQRAMALALTSTRELPAIGPLRDPVGSPEASKHAALPPVRLRAIS